MKDSISEQLMFLLSKIDCYILLFKYYIWTSYKIVNIDIFIVREEKICKRQYVKKYSITKNFSLNNNNK